MFGQFNYLHVIGCFLVCVMITRVVCQEDNYPDSKQDNYDEAGHVHFDDSGQTINYDDSNQKDQKVEPEIRGYIKKIDRYRYPHPEDPRLQGIWRKKMIWKPRWVKTWEGKKVFVAIWKKMWGPVEINEWVPIPRPPPGWAPPIDHGQSVHLKKIG